MNPEELKKAIKALLGDQYYLGMVHTMLGVLPVIAKEPIPNQHTAVAHLYPGEQTDALDGADKKCIDSCVEIPEDLFNDWLTRKGDTVLEAIRQAIVNIERPDKWIPWYETKNPEQVV